MTETSQDPNLDALKRASVRIVERYWANADHEEGIPPNTIALLIDELAITARQYGHQHQPQIIAMGFTHYFYMVDGVHAPSFVVQKGDDHG